MPRYNITFKFPTYELVVSTTADTPVEAIVIARAQEQVDPVVRAIAQIDLGLQRGGARPGAGNPGGPRTDNPRTVIKQIRWTVEEWERIEAAARVTGQSVTDYQRGAMLVGHDPVFIDGINAGYAGKPKTDNPHPHGSTDGWSWRIGHARFYKDPFIERIET